MTLRQPAYAQQAAFEETVLFYRLHNVLRTGRVKPARRRKQRRDTLLVELYQLQCQPLHSVFRNSVKFCQTSLFLRSYLRLFANPFLSLRKRLRQRRDGPILQGQDFPVRRPKYLEKSLLFAGGFCCAPRRYPLFSKRTILAWRYRFRSEKRAPRGACLYRQSHGGRPAQTRRSP